MGRKSVSVTILFLALLPALTQAAEPVKIDTLCKQLVEYQPSNDVNYEPGTDQYGRPVAPADLEGSPQIKLPDVTTVQITVDQAAQLGLPNTIGYKPEAYIGDVSVSKNGDVYFNGQRISQSQIQALCNEKPASKDDTPPRPVVPADLPNP